jgi:hypothetical protein
MRLVPELKSRGVRFAGADEDAATVLTLRADRMLEFAAVRR